MTFEWECQQCESENVSPCNEGLHVQCSQCSAWHVVDLYWYGTDFECWGVEIVK